MKKIFLMACAAVMFASTSVASAEQQNEWGYTGDDYTGPFTTQTLYTMCSQKKTRDKCLAYIQGLEYGIAISKSMAEKSPSLRFCPPRMTPEEARVRILKFIDGTTEANRQITRMRVIGWHIWELLLATLASNQSAVKDPISDGFELGG